MKRLVVLVMGLMLISMAGYSAPAGPYVQAWIIGNDTATSSNSPAVGAVFPVSLPSNYNGSSTAPFKVQLLDTASQPFGTQANPITEQFYKTTYCATEAIDINTSAIPYIINFTGGSNGYECQFWNFTCDGTTGNSSCTIYNSISGTTETLYANGSSDYFQVPVNTIILNPVFTINQTSCTDVNFIIRGRLH